MAVEGTPEPDCLLRVAGRLVHRDFSYAHDRDTTCSPTSFSVHGYDTANVPASPRLVRGACAQARARLHLTRNELSGCVPSSLENQLGFDSFSFGDLSFC